VVRILTALAILLVPLGQVVAQTVVPNSPTAGQPFTVTGFGCGTFAPRCTITIFHSAPFLGCPATIGSPVYPSTGVGSGFTGVWSTTVPGLPAGSYCIVFNNSFTLNYVGFTVNPATTGATQYTPITIGGRMLPLNLFQLIIPWFVLIAVLSVVSVWTLVVKRARGDQ